MRKRNGMPLKGLRMCKATSKVNAKGEPKAKAIAIAGAVAIAGMLTGCADESPWGSTGTETGSLELNLTTDYDFDTSKPIFRSGEDETRATVALADYTDNVPTAEKFTILLENTNGYSKEWVGLTAFKTSEEIKKLPTGLYTITAYYGEKGEQGEDLPYFEATSSFTVLPNRASEVSLTAEMKNSMVYIDYTDDFKAYMASYTTTLSTPGNAQDAIPMNAKKAVFVEPGSVDITVDFKTRETSQEAKINVGNFQSVAKTLHKMTFDIDHKNNGFATLTISFDETVENTETINVDLTAELFATDGPSISYAGSAPGGTPIENGSTIDMTLNPESVAMSVLVPGGLNTANLTVTGTNNYSEVIDLRNTDSTSLTGRGIKAQGFYGTVEQSNTLALLDITEYVKGLASGEYTVKLEVKDKSNRSASFMITVNNETPTMTMAKDNSNQSLTTSIAYGASNSQIVFDYNGNDYQNITFKATDANGNMSAVTSTYDRSETISRASEMRRCYYTVTLPYSVKKKEVSFEAYDSKGSNINSFTVPVAVPAYKIETDAFAHYAFLKIVPENSTDLATIMDNIEFKSIDASNISQNKETGIITVVGLTPGIPYEIGSSITGGDDNWKTTASFTAETEKEIPNGDFSKTSLTINEQDIEVGGKYSYSVAYQATANIVVYEPDGWSSINAKTCWFGCQGAKNTWFQVPSTLVDTNNGNVILRNVAYDHNGVKPDGMPTGLGKTYWYNTNVPTFTHFAAGELFLGNYSYDGNEHRTDGISFESRPSSIMFDYSYTPTGNDTGYVAVTVKDSSNTPISSIDKELTGNSEGFTIDLPAYTFGKKAAKIEICFRSSSSIEPKDYVHIPSGSELKEGFNGAYFGNKNLGDNNYHALATGSVLTIDNIKAVYAKEPAFIAESKNSKRNRR